VGERIDVLEIEEAVDPCIPQRGDRDSTNLSCVREWLMKRPAI
jgi:hypothetical protein